MMQYLLCATVFDAYYRCCGIHSQNLVDSAKPLLRKAIQISQQTPYWHCRLLFQLAVCIISHTFNFNFIFLVTCLFTCRLDREDKYDIEWFLLLLIFGVVTLVFYFPQRLKIKRASGIDLNVTFLSQQLHTLEKDLVSACDLLGVGAEYARVVGSEYTR